MKLPFLHFYGANDVKTVFLSLSGYNGYRKGEREKEPFYFIYNFLTSSLLRQKKKISLPAEYSGKIGPYSLVGTYQTTYLGYI